MLLLFLFLYFSLPSLSLPHHPPLFVPPSDAFVRPFNTLLCAVSVSVYTMMWFISFSLFPSLFRYTKCARAGAWAFTHIHDIRWHVRRYGNGYDGYSYSCHYCCCCCGSVAAYRLVILLYRYYTLHANICIRVFIWCECDWLSKQTLTFWSHSTQHTYHICVWSVCQCDVWRLVFLWLLLFFVVAVVVVHVCIYLYFVYNSHICLNFCRQFFLSRSLLANNSVIYFK